MEDEMRSLLAAFAAAYFLYNALTFIPQGAALILNPAQRGGIDGDPGAVAVTWAARTLFTGLVLLSLSVMEWEKILAPLSRRQSSS
jgi:hypothetical protein